jgi:hypothetical protein
LDEPNEETFASTVAATVIIETTTALLRMAILLPFKSEADV